MPSLQCRDDPRATFRAQPTLLLHSFNRWSIDGQCIERRRMVAEQGGELFFQRIDLPTNMERLFQRFDGVMQEGIEERHTPKIPTNQPNRQ